MKRNPFHWFVGLGLPSLAALFLVAEAQACECLPNPPPKEALAKAAAVFSGKVVKNEAKGGTLIVTFSIQEVWKGVDGKTVVVVTSSSGKSCGYSFQQDQSYLVYAYQPFLHVSLCSRTTPLEKAQDDLKEIGQGKAP